MDAVKTLLMASVAVSGAGAAAEAADLPVRKAAPVDDVRVCDWTGVGFFTVPGIDACLPSAPSCASKARSAPPRAS